MKYHIHPFPRISNIAIVLAVNVLILTGCQATKHEYRIALEEGTYQPSSANLDRRAQEIQRMRPDLSEAEAYSAARSEFERIYAQPEGQVGKDRKQEEFESDLSRVLGDSD